MPVLHKTFMNSSEVINHGSMRISLKQNNSPPCGPSKTSQIQRKWFVEQHFEANGRLFLRQNWLCSDCSNVARSILSGTLQFLWRNTKNEQEKRIIVLNGNASSRTSAQNVELTSFYLHIKKMLHGQQFSPIFVKLVFSSHCIDGRTSTGSEYDYVEKCPTFQWKCHIAAGNSRNMPGQ